MGDPLTPDEMQRRVLEQCKQTKETLTDVSKAEKMRDPYKPKI